MSSRAARKEAARIVTRYHSGGAPVLVDLIARRMGLPVILEDLGDDVSGLLAREGDSAYIVVNKRDHPNRRRFTIAHEIGHFALEHAFQGEKHVHVDRGNIISYRDSLASAGIDPQEIEANQFAADLLMPRDLIHAEIRELGLSRGLFDQHVRQLADRFRVSEQAMTIRLSNLLLL